MNFWKPIGVALIVAGGTQIDAPFAALRMMPGEIGLFGALNAMYSNLCIGAALIAIGVFMTEK